MTRRLALLLCAIQATATAGVAAQVRPHDCSDSPTPAYRPTVRVDANVR